MNFKFLSSLLFFMLPIFLIMGCNKKDLSNGPQYYKISGPAQGTSYHITLKTDRASELQEQIDDLIEAIDKSMSTYRADSFISAWNENRLSEGQKADSYFMDVLQSSFELYDMTRGLFDPTVGPLLSYYGFGKNTDRKMDTASLEELRNVVGLDKVLISEDQTILKSNDGVTLNFNANAQGYTVDQIALTLEQAGCLDYMVELGGEVRVAGLNPDAKEWTIGIEKPIEGLEQQTASNRLEHALIMPSGFSMATSGNYRNYRTNPETGKKYGHIIDPINMQPIESQLLSVTVVHNNCMTADALATAIMAMGYEHAKSFVENQNLSTILIYSTEDGVFQSDISEDLQSRLKQIEQD